MDKLNWKDIMRFISEGNPKPDSIVTKNEGEWKELLTDEQYQIARKKGTERAFAGEYCESFEPGVYECICCQMLLFDSNVKFESGTGWPSFTQPVKHNAVAYHKDKAFGMVRVEITCNTCGSHLGHVFPDGPKPEGLRYCVNSISLKKREA